jgi:hypothetical protein
VLARMVDGSLYADRAGPDAVAAESQVVLGSVQDGTCLIILVVVAKLGYAGPCLTNALTGQP